MSALESIPATRGRPTRVHLAVLEALAGVTDDHGQPITELGYVRSVAVRGHDLEIGLRLPGGGCSADPSYLITADVLDALQQVPDVGAVRLSLADHPDAARINRELAEDTPTTFRRRAHRAAAERCCSRLLRETAWTLEELHWLTLLDLHAGPDKDALLRRRVDVGLDVRPHSRVVVDDDGRVLSPGDVPAWLYPPGSREFCGGQCARHPLQ